MLEVEYCSCTDTALKHHSYKRRTGVGTVEEVCRHSQLSLTREMLGVRYPISTSPGMVQIPARSWVPEPFEGVEQVPITVPREKPRLSLPSSPPQHH